MEIAIRQSVDRDEWDGLVSSSAAGNIFYTALWGEVRRKFFRSSPYYLTLKDDGKVAALAVIEAMALGHSRLYGKPLGSILLPLAVKRMPVLRMRDWVFIDNDIKMAIDRGELAARTEKALAGLRPIEARVYQNALDGASVYGDALVERGFERDEWATFVVSLEGETKKIEERFRSSVRKALRKAGDEQGLAVERISDLDGLKEYYSLFRSWRSAMRLWSTPFDEWRVMWNELRQYGSSFEIFVAKQGEKAVGGLGIWAYNGIMNEFGSVRSPYAAQKNLYAGDILKREIIKWGRGQGFRFYDLEGVSNDPKNGKDAAIRQFKEKWGGQFKRCDVFRKSFAGKKRAVR